ncbi:MAG: hypothetical protein CTY35_00155 [Methylotenera sp.]|uniref:hypothetical protein n=1 Tax=Methylotenera sp. TaxID=2051956 RepID=UPI000D426906|nr:hypothetical protein [Methylotenera sp.]PPC84768.1 MAG: hypothetical protein CTY38_00155 [Methylotenera sp.]PPD02127.1 MAG: hypothetical protein CTY35_00155 [Methylotenera sp.]
MALDNYNDLPDDSADNPQVSSEWDDGGAYPQHNNDPDEGMSNTSTPSSRAYQEADPDPEDQDEDDHKVSPTPLWKVLMWGVIVIGVLFFGLVAYALLTKEPEAPKISMKPAQAMPIKPAQPVIPEPGGYDPTLGAAPVDPLQNTEVSNTTPTPIDTTISPFTGQSTAPAAPITASNPATAPVSTVVAAPVNTTVPNQTIGNTPATGVNAGVTAPTPVQAAPVLSPEAKQDERIAALEAKIAELQALINELTAPKAKKVAAVRKESAPVLVKKDKPVATTLKQIASKEAQLATVATTSTSVNTEAPIATVTTAPKSASRPHLVAIVPGRAFLQNSEGIRSDVAVGDNVSGCGAVIKIDADNAEVVTDRCVIH